MHSPMIAIWWVGGLSWLFWRQFHPRPVARRPRISLVLIALGAVETVLYLSDQSLPGTALLVLTGSFAVGLALSAARSRTVRLWPEDGTVWRRGTATTMVLWIVALAVHFASGRLVVDTGGPAGTSSATVLLYLGVALLTQTLLVRQRAAHLTAR